MAGKWILFLELGELLGRPFAIALLQARQTLIVDRVGRLFGQQLGLIFFATEGIQGIQRGAASSG